MNLLHIKTLVAPRVPGQVTLDQQLLVCGTVGIAADMLDE
jgi:hypothetical protein